MRIKKVNQTTPTTAQVVDGYSESTTDAYSANYVNGTELYNSEGTTQDFKLSESSANYKRIIIESYNTRSGLSSTHEIISPNGKKALLMSHYNGRYAILVYCWNNY